MVHRTIILHYHLFKNAGTSLDRVLKTNFPGAWVTREFKGQNNTADVIEWIKDTPNAIAYSSHTMMGPLPQVSGVEVVPVMIFRDPISRIRSAYRFERDQRAETFGAILAKHTTLEGYIRVRLAAPGDRQCENFQTWRLASLLPSKASMRERALTALGDLEVTGRVESFDDVLRALRVRLAHIYPDFDLGAESTRANVSRKKSELEYLSDELEEILLEKNADDLAVLRELASNFSR